MGGGSGGRKKLLWNCLPALADHRPACSPRYCCVHLDDLVPSSTAIRVQQVDSADLWTHEVPKEDAKSSSHLVEKALGH
jgi:hypothetical protein